MHLYSTLTNWYHLVDPVSDHLEEAESYVDASLQLIGTVENGTELGIPQGISADGDIFSMGVTPLGSWVTRTEPWE